MRRLRILCGVVVVAALGVTAPLLVTGSAGQVLPAVVMPIKPRPVPILTLPLPPGGPSPRRGGRDLPHG
jgi:hypothetical protein